eukprot:3450585-Pyramimonas_sp.AAC.1
MDGPSEFAQRAANVVKDGVSDHMEELKKAATAALKTPYAETLNAKPISEVAGGAKDSQIWSAALKDNATFDQIKKVASTTLVTINTAAFSSAVAKLEKHAEEVFGHGPNRQHLPLLSALLARSPIPPLPSARPRPRPASLKRAARVIQGAF